MERSDIKEGEKENGQNVSILNHTLHNNRNTDLPNKDERTPSEKETCEGGEFFDGEVNRIGIPLGAKSAPYGKLQTIYILYSTGDSQQANRNFFPSCKEYFYDSGLPTKRGSFHWIG